MSKEVRHDGSGAFEVRFPFDRGLVDLIKTLPNRRWNASERYWSVPDHDVVQLVELLHPERFRFDDTTVAAYRDLGGTLSLDGNEHLPTASRPGSLFDDSGDSPSGPGSPGSFDDGSATAKRDPASSKSVRDYTVSALNRHVKQVLASAFPGPVWLVGEISGFNRNDHKRIVGFQLAEHGSDGKNVSSVSATLFEQERRAISSALARAGDPFRLEDEVTVRLRVRVELYVPWGSYRVIVEDLDVNYTLGEAARRREEIIRRLTEQGLVGLNTSLPLPALPLRVGLITSLGSDAYNDVLRTFEESGYAFRVEAHGARVQGHSTEPSVLNALDYFRGRHEQLDVVLICRGGGSRTDLAWFDSEALGQAVARFPIPVVCGIGHEQDYSVLDAVAWRNKTPTAAAAFLVDTVRTSLEQIETRCAGVLRLASARLLEERNRGFERARRLALAARGSLQRELTELQHRRRRSGRAARALVGSATERLDRLTRDVPRAASVHVTRQRGLLDAAARTMSQAARRDIDAASRTVAEDASLLGPRVRRLLLREEERVESRQRRLFLVDPRRVVERGYAILRLEDEGSVLTDARTAPGGTALRAELRSGALRLRSEGRAAPSAEENESGE